MTDSYDWSADVAKTEGRPGAHWLGAVEQSDLLARFKLLAVQNDTKSEKLGRPFFEDVLHTEILMPGGDIVVRKFQEGDRHKFPAAWAAWERDQSTPNEGTPLEEWPQMTPSAIQTLKASNVYTVENLLALSDANCEQIGPIAYMFREKARDYAKRAEGQSSELDEVKAQNAELQEQLKAMQAAIDDLRKPKRRGRPVGSKNKPKVKNEPASDHTGRNGPSEPAEA